MKSLAEWIDSLGRTPVMPLMGYPGMRLTNTSIKLNEFNWGVQSWSIHELYHRFRPDGVFLLMDLAVEASALGLQVRFPLLDSPSVEIHPVREELDLDQFIVADVLKDGRVMAFVEAARQLTSILPAGVLRCAYVTAPFTLAGLMMGASEMAIKIMLEEKLVRQVLDVATNATIRYARALAEAGVQLIMLLDPSAVMMGPAQYQTFAKPSVRIVDEALEEIPIVYHICGDSRHLIGDICSLGVAGVSLDSSVHLPAVAEQLPDEMILVGNIASVDIMMNATASVVEATVRELRKGMEPYKNFILSTSCDLPLETPPENIDAFMRAGAGKR